MPRLSSDTDADIIAACPEVPPATVTEFLSRMDPDYRSLFTPEEIAVHIRLSAQLDEDTPVRLDLRPRKHGRYDVVVVAFDYFSELSVLCGLLAAFGFDIESGRIYTFSAPPPAALQRQGRRGPRVSPKKIVDVFRVRLLPGESFDDERRRLMDAELLALVKLLAAGRTDEARDRLNRHLIEHFDRFRERFSGVLSPVDVRFDNDLDPQWTIMDVHARDTPAFLYAVSNALATRAVYVHKVAIESVGNDVRDRFFIADRRGGKIEGREQEALRTAVVLIKQFTHFLPRAPDPAKASRHFDQFLDRVMTSLLAGARLTVLTEREGLADLALLLGSSDFLWDDFLQMNFDDLLPILEGMRDRPLRRGAEALRGVAAAELATARDHADRREALNRFKDRELFFADMKYVVDPETTAEEFSAALTDLAEVVLEEALAISRRHVALNRGGTAGGALAVFGLGKFGGAELGYASDMELLFVYDGGDPDEAVAVTTELVEMIEAREEGIFHIDLRLRPYGSKGPLATTLSQIQDYYREGGAADPFERQALTKLRWVAGDEALGRAVEAQRDAFTYSGAAWDVAEAVRMRERQSRELAEPGQVNIKYSPGGLIDVEYAVQYLQIMEGARRPEVRTPRTLTAVDRLRDAGVLTIAEHADLSGGYVLLRRVLDGLRMVRGNARDLVLPAADSEGMKFLARRLGYRGTDWDAESRRLAADIQGAMGRIASRFDERFGRVHAAART